MPIVFYINSFIAILTTFVIFYVFLKASKTLLKTATILLLFFVLSRSLLLIIYQDSRLSLENFKILYQIISVIDIFGSSCFLLFFVVFTERIKLIKSKLFLILLILIPSFFVYKQLNFQMTNVFLKTAFGWEVVAPQTLIVNLFYLYFAIFNFFGIYLIFYFLSGTREWIKRKQSVLFLIAGFLMIFFDFLINFVLNKIEIIVPNRIDIPSLVWCFVILFAMAKYKFLSITFSEAAKNIVSVMPDGLFFLDANHKIIQVNQSVFNSLGYSEKELEGQSIENLVSPSERDNLSKLVSAPVIKDKQIKLITKDKMEIPFIISGVTVNDRENDPYYIILIVKDAKEIKNYAASRLSKLTPILQKVSQGDFSQTIEIPPEKDEFTDHLIALKLMIDNFKNLVKEINNKSSQLEYQNQELEKVSGQLQQKLLELERFNKAAAGRDVKLNELIKELEKIKAKNE